MKDFIKKVYGSIAKGKQKSCCSPDVCCTRTRGISENIGYSSDIDKTVISIKISAKKYE